MRSHKRASLRLQTCSISWQLSWVFSGAIPGDGPRPWQLVQVGRYSQPSSWTADISNVRLAMFQPSLGVWMMVLLCSRRPSYELGIWRNWTGKNSPASWIPKKRIRAKYLAVHVNGLTLMGLGRKPVTFLRIERRRSRSPDGWGLRPGGRFSGEPGIYPVRRRSPTEPIRNCRSLRLGLGRSQQLCRRTKKLLLMCQANLIELRAWPNPWEIERPCRHSVTPFLCQVKNGLYIHLSSKHWHGNGESHYWICLQQGGITNFHYLWPCSRSISHGSRCSVNELECTVGIRIATTSSVTMGAREGPTGPVRTDPHCRTLAPGHLVPTTLRDVGSVSTPETQHSSVTIPALRSHPSRYVQSPATLCSRDLSVDVASRVSRPQRESTLAIYESKWRIFTAWCNMQHLNPLSSTESVVSDFLLHLHMERHLAISTIAGYQMAIANTLRATSDAEVGRNPELQSLLRNISKWNGHHQRHFQSKISL